MNYDTWLANRAADDDDYLAEEDEGYFDEDAAYESYREGF